MKNNSHIAKQVLFGLMLLLFVGNIKSQVGYEKKFLKFFKAQSLAGKVNAFDTLDNDFKEACYPYVKDELEKIREQAIIDHQDEILNKFMKIEAQMFFVRQNYSKAIPLFTDLLAKHKIKSYKDSASVLYCLKNAYIKLHSLNKAIEIHKVMMGLKRRYADIDSWLFHPKLSIIYYEMKMYKECLNQQLLEFDEIKNSKPMLLGYFNNRGLFWQKYGNLDSALMCFNTAKEVFYSFHNNPKLYTIDDEFVLGLIEGNIGQVYIEQKEYKKAIPLLEKDIVSSMNAKDTLNAAVSEIELARCYLNLNQAQLCKKYLDNANAKLQRIEDYKSKLNIIKQYAVYYDKIGAYRQSIDFYNRYINFKDSIDYKENLKGKNIVCVISGGNNDIERMPDFKERSLIFEGLKHFFIIKFPQRAGALKQFVTKVLSDNEDITLFEYTKKNSKESGPALVGIELKYKEDYEQLIKRMNKYKVDFVPLNDNPMLFNFLI